jgi:hypothetical protein
MTMARWTQAARPHSHHAQQPRDLAKAAQLRRADPAAATPASEATAAPAAAQRPADELAGRASDLTSATAAAARATVNSALRHEAHSKSSSS